MNTKTIKKLDVLSTGTTFGLLYTVSLALYAAIVSFGARGFVEAVFMVFFVSLFGALIGFLVGVVTAWAYNIAAKYTGGIKVEIE
jgi:hypothetical protein